MSRSPLHREKENNSVNKKNRSSNSNKRPRVPAVKLSFVLLVRWAEVGVRLHISLQESCLSRDDRGASVGSLGFFLFPNTTSAIANLQNNSQTGNQTSQVSREWCISETLKGYNINALSMEVANRKK